jgi:hypothetical protein
MVTMILTWMIRYSESREILLCVILVMLITLVNYTCCAPFMHYACRGVMLLPRILAVIPSAQVNVANGMVQNDLLKA